MEKKPLKRLLLLAGIFPFVSFHPSPVQSPLAAYSTEWNKPEYSTCNTAAKVAYMSQPEKEVIYILNLARKYPALFLETVIKKYPLKSGQEQLIYSSYYKSLADTFKTLNPMNLLVPDAGAFYSAKCHATQTGKDGITGHERSDECEKIKDFRGECCDYGGDTPLEVVMDLLIDEGVPSLGHREICLDSYKKLGVSIQPHTIYRHTTVMDFK